MLTPRSPAGSRDQLLGRLAAVACSLSPGHPTRVAIDGPDAAGKSTMADELVTLVERAGRQAVRVSLDGFHRPRSERYQRGELSAEGYYRDSFDLDAVRLHVLEPLGPGGDRTFRTAMFDVAADVPAAERECLAEPNAVLLFDGVFLLRPELRRYWDFAIFLEATSSEILRRALARDGERFASEEHLRERYERRYLPAHRLYRAEANPSRVADVVIENTDPSSPVLTRTSR